MAEHAFQTSRFLRCPDSGDLVRQEFASVGVSRIHEERQLFVGIFGCHGLFVQFFKLGGVFVNGKLVGPEEHAFSLFDKVDLRKPGFFELLFCVVDHALKRMMHVVNVAARKQHVFKLVAGNAMRTVVYQDLQQVGHL